MTAKSASRYLCAVLALTASISAVAAEEESGPGIQEIVVTARKREENLQGVPISISAITADRIQADGVQSVQDLQYLVPGLSVSSTNGGGFLFIRGVGSDIIGPGGEPGVAYNLDGVYVGRLEAALTQFSDVERIEVLRGPQGTLYGRNATGGSVNVITRAPSDTLSLYGNVMAGNYNAFETEEAISGPITDDLKGRVDVRYARRDGFVKNLLGEGPLRTELAPAAPGLVDPLVYQRGRSAPDTLDGQNVAAVQGKLVFTPFTASEITLASDYTHDNTSGPDLVPLAHTGLIFGLGANPPASRYQARIDEGVFEDKGNFGVSATGKFGFDGLTLKSISAYRHFTNQSLLDSDGDEIRGVDFYQNLHQNQLSEELQLSGTTQRLDWITGAFFLRERANWDGDVFAAFPFPFNQPPIPPGTNPPANIIFQFQSRNTTNAWAGFGQGSYHLTDTLSATLGVRFSHEQKQYVGNTPPLLPEVAHLSNSWHAWTPKYGLEYKPTQDVLLYASASRGFKSGGYNATATSPLEQRAFNPEFLWAYETGIKTTLLNRRLQVNSSVFYYDYKDLQTFAFTGLAAAIIVNAAAAENYGGEIEITALPVDNLRTYFSAAYLHATYTRFLAGGAPIGVPGEVNLSGNTIRNSPKGSFNAGLEYRFGFANGTSLTVGGDANYKTRVYFDQYNTSVLSQPGFLLVNSRIALQLPGDAWEIAARARNLTDKQYLTGAVALSGQNFTPQGYVGDRRLYELQVSYRFH